MKKSFGEKEKQLNQLRTEMTPLKHQLKAVQSKVAEKVANAKNPLENKIRILNKNISEARKRNADNKIRINKLNSQLEEANDSIDIERERSVKLKNEVESLKVLLKESKEDFINQEEIAQKTLSEKDETIDHILAKIDENKLSIADAYEKEKRLIKEMAVLKADIAKVNALRLQELQQLEVKLNEQKQGFDKDLVSLKKGNQDKKKNIEELQMQANQLNVELEKVRGGKDTAEKKLAELKAQLKEVEKSIPQRVREARKSVELQLRKAQKKAG